MKKKILLLIQTVLLALFVQGCWAGEKVEADQKESSEAHHKNTNAVNADPDRLATGRYVQIPVRMPNPIPGGLYPEICDAFLKNIQVKDGNHVPVSCQVELDPKLKEFDKPDWRDLNEQDGVRYLDMMYKYDAEFRYHVKWKKGEAKEKAMQAAKFMYERNLEYLKEHIKMGEAFIVQMAEFDFNNNGDLDFVVRRKPSPICDRNGIWGMATMLYLLTHDKDSIDEHRIEPRNFSDAFFYKGQTFFYERNYSNFGFTIRRPSKILGTSETYVQDVCAYKYEVETPSGE